jgi:hypothetical protein
MDERVKTEEGGWIVITRGSADSHPRTFSLQSLFYLLDSIICVNPSVLATSWALDVIMPRMVM